MNTYKLSLNCVSSHKILVLALMAAFGPVHAADAEVADLISPNETSVSAGAGTVVGGGTKGQALFGQYNGLSQNESQVLLDFEHVRREDETGLWTRAEGRNLGRDDRELNFSQEKQGDWKYQIGYSELTHRDPLSLNTGLTGIGSTTPTANTVALGAGSTTNLELKRKAISLAGQKWLSSNWMIEANIKTEDKDGARLSGIGGYCSNAISPICTSASSTLAALFLLPEPVRYTTQQIEGELHYVGEKFSLTGGYYGSFFTNANSTVALGGIGGVLGAGGTQAALAANLGLPVALPPDNQAHQFYLSGTYALQPTTRVNFKLAYTHATQNESFGSLGAGSLNGAVDTTLAQAGLTMRPIKNLTLNVSGRYDEKKDRTQLGNYLVDAAGSLYTNSPNNSVRMNGKAEALYQFSSAYRGSLAVDYDYINRDRLVATTLVPSTSMAAMRERTNEVGVRAELRRSMSETVNGAISLGHSERDGYRWYSLGPTSGYAFMSYAASHGLSGTFPMTMVDRNRDSVKVMADWAATEALSVQASVEQGKDTFKGPTSAGLNDTDAFSFNIDASYKLDDMWALTGYASSGKQTLRMRQQIGYIADLSNLSSSAGLGATGKVSSNLEMGFNVSVTEDRNSYQIGMTTGAAVANPPPDETYRSTILKLFGKYALDKASEVQLELLHQRMEYDQWAWASGGVPFTYSDNSTVTVQPVQQVTYLGVKYVHRYK